MLDTPEEVAAAYEQDDQGLMYAAAYTGHAAEDIDPAFFERLSLRENGPDSESQGPDDPPRPPRSNEDAMQLLPHHHANGQTTHSHPGGSDVGLYLP